MEYNNIIENIENINLRPMLETGDFSIYQTHDGYFVVALVGKEVVVRGPWSRATPAVIEGIVLTH